MTGFIQMAVGAGAAQLAAQVVAGASDAVPMLLVMLVFGVATAAAVFRPGPKLTRYRNLCLASALFGHNAHRNEVTPMLMTILIIVLILALIGALPTWGYSRNWGYGPGGGLGLILIIIIVLALTGRI